MSIRIKFEERQERNVQELLHMMGNETRDLVLINVEYIENVYMMCKIEGRNVHVGG